MAVSEGTIFVEWGSGADTKALTTGTPDADSEEFNLSNTAFDAMVALKASNGGTPASGDVVDFFLKMTTGDTDDDADTTDEFDTDEHGTYLATIDTNAESTGDGQKTVPLPSAAFKGAKIQARSRASSNTITVSARLYEKKVA